MEKIKYNKGNIVEYKSSSTNKAILGIATKDFTWEQCKDGFLNWVKSLDKSARKEVKDMPVSEKDKIFIWLFSVSDLVDSNNKIHNLDNPN